MATLPTAQEMAKMLKEDKNKPHNRIAALEKEIKQMNKAIELLVFSGRLSRERWELALEMAKD